MSNKKKRSKRQRLERVTVRGERRPEMDWDRYAYALLMYARVVQAEREKQRAAANRQEGEPEDGQ